MTQVIGKDILYEPEHDRFVLVFENSTGVRTNSITATFNVPETLRDVRAIFLHEYVVDNISGAHYHMILESTPGSKISFDTTSNVAGRFGNQLVIPTQPSSSAFRVELQNVKSIWKGREGNFNNLKLTLRFPDISTTFERALLELSFLANKHNQKLVHHLKL